MLNSLTKMGQSSCATVVQAASKTALHACKPCSPKIEPLRVQTIRISHIPDIASVQCTSLHNFFRPLAFLLNRKEQFRVKRVKRRLTTIFTNFKSPPLSIEKSIRRKRCLLIQDNNNNRLKKQRL
jgi:hypothetical protein